MEEIFWVRCQDCGNTWMLDYEPPGEFCESAPWSLGISDTEYSPVVWGSTVDQEGNNV